MRRKLAPMPNNPNGSMVTYASECMAVIHAACLGVGSHLDRVAPFFIENTHNTLTGTVGYFTDPHDGRRYRISVEPINVFEGDDQEPNFNSPQQDAEDAA